MTFDNIWAFITSLSTTHLLILSVLAACVAVASCVTLYVGIRAAFDGLKDLRSRQADRQTWFSEQARIHRDTSA
jgi:chloramphenicol 3-O-phosphotransferase